eukprot:TRINITY_DN5945_c0_g1_i1.p1 TRINITY_DN5945_c0_g1~~TRINITY_DN5945_c0_g1_i1.p1  ORF type:complete len:287 (-),score=50.08 TRINITY_DN5945_c0_g1_i1:47-874(-)
MAMASRPSMQVDEGLRNLTTIMEDVIRQALDGAEKMSPESFNSGHQLVYNLCTQKEHCYDQIYKLYGAVLDQHLMNKVLREVRGLHDVELLQQVLVQYRLNQRIGKWLASIFAYLERNFTKALKLAPLYASSQNSFRVLVFDKVQEDVLHVLLRYIEHARSQLKDGISVLAEEPAHSAVCAIVTMLQELTTERFNAYEQSLEAPLLRSLNDTYRMAADVHDGAGRALYAQQELELFASFATQATLVRLASLLQRVLRLDVAPVVPTVRTADAAER